MKCGDDYPWRNPKTCKCPNNKKPVLYAARSRSEGYLCPHEIKRRKDSIEKSRLFPKVRVPELKQKCKNKKLPTTGRKKDLFDRLSLQQIKSITRTKHPV